LRRDGELLHRRVNLIPAINAKSVSKPAAWWWGRGCIGQDHVARDARRLGTLYVVEPVVAYGDQAARINGKMRHGGVPKSVVPFHGAHTVGAQHIIKEPVLADVINSRQTQFHANAAGGIVGGRHQTVTLGGQAFEMGGDTGLEGNDGVGETLIEVFPRQVMGQPHHVKKVGPVPPRAAAVNLLETGFGFGWAVTLGHGQVA